MPDRSQDTMRFSKFVLLRSALDRLTLVRINDLDFHL